MNATRHRHNWRYKETSPGVFTTRICVGCGERQTWGFVSPSSNSTPTAQPAPPAEHLTADGCRPSGSS